MNVYGWIALAFAAILAGWQWDHSSSQLDALGAAVEATQEERDRVAAANIQFAQLLLDRQALDEKLSVISVGTRAINQALTGQAAQWRQDFAELKRNDDQVRAYLAAPVPAALGVRYARPATIDPLAWGSGPAAHLPAGSVSAAGSPGPGQ